MSTLPTEPEVDPRDLLASIVDSADDAILSKDLDGRVLSINSAGERLFGYAATELVGHSILTLVPEERHEEEASILAQLRLGERLTDFVTVRRTKEGAHVDVALTVSPVRDRDGRIVGASTIARDVGSGRRIELALAELAAIVTSSDDAILSIDVDGIVRSFNAAAERMYGHAAKDIVGGPVHRLIPPERHAEEEEILARLRAGERVHHYETVRVRRDGSRFDVSLTVSPLRDARGTVVGASKIARDISATKRMAAERERLLENERAARADAERASRVKDDFVALVSHELRTPLNAILGWAELLHHRPGDLALAQHGLEVIVRNARLQNQLIGDLLDVSRIVAGKLHVEFQDVDLSSIVGGAVDSLRSTAQERRVHLALQRPFGHVRVAGDPARLQQIVLNLVSNALKFTPAGGKVTVELAVDGPSAILVVRDTGAGIRADFIPVLFERFRQESSATTRRHGGLGLGLSIAKHLTERHWGTIRAASDGEGCGATFTVTLPLLGSGPALDVNDPATESANCAPTLADARVLLVEDDDDTRELVRRILEEHGAAVTAAASGPDALVAAEITRPNLMVSDIGLPDMDGYELIARVRRLAPPVGSIPAVALTAFARPEDRTRALRAGFNGHIAKPVEPAELVATIAGLGRLRQDAARWGAQRDSPGTSATPSA